MSRTETDSIGPIEVADDVYWGAQTQRSLENFAIGNQQMPLAVVHALATVKKAAARVNLRLGELPEDVATLIEKASSEILDGFHDDQFPLVVWQTGSGTQSNMNVNEVIAGRSNELAGNGMGGKKPVHPNDHVNRGQSSNDCFPTAMHIATALAVQNDLLPAIAELSGGLALQSARYQNLVKTGRTHMMDATPVTFGQELSAFVAQLDLAERAIRNALPAVLELAQGGTAVGTGLNAPKGFDEAIAKEIAELTGLPFVTAPNKFAALAGHEPLVALHGGLKTLAVALMKIANDLRLLGSGPRAGFAEVKLPANEPGSSIMPGKVNPTQCEALSMLACQVIGNDVTVGFAASQGHLQLNVYKPVIAHNVLESIRLLADGCRNFNTHCVTGMEPDEHKMAEHLEQGLMLVTALNPHIGYDKAAEIAKKAYAENKTLRAAALELGYLTDAQFDEWVRPETMLEAGGRG
ncbi:MULTISPECIES: class II fumarate hydratase [Pseudomonadaceae]|jgi:fumarate hydratase class II|uniref:Fumarate hydratase class II n=2 Tax=Pseudomonadaceae TaxID=135621 RepID=A0A1G5PCW5_9PSED|nr:MULTISPECIES: class II fumarate hydratase [Pseudomonas]HCV77493.1 class II fumarate hydratase [Pseudomonas sp.]EHK69183.1 fumarate hydratase [Pseudomonas psychrotolerans L19]KIZ49246.1 fumarate hydratase [Pseudomonas oryzihabitans]MBA1181451.1 class II fumarate hydratase [Pseudomonas psychrotolerans]MBA1213214.1 class II fumarate hydratase [Pseudomonas psychrotolerans]